MGLTKLQFKFLDGSYLLLPFFTGWSVEDATFNTLIDQEQFRRRFVSEASFMASSFITGRPEYEDKYYWM